MTDAHHSNLFQLFLSFNIAPGHVWRRLLFARPIVAWFGEKLLFLRVPVIVFGLQLVKRVPFGGALESVPDLQNTSSQISVETRVYLFLGVITSLVTGCN